MWKPPADQVVSDTGWKPPADAVVPETQQPQAQQPENPGSQLDVAKAAMSAVSDMAPWNKANQALKNVGGNIAEAGGYAGAKLESAGYPNAGNAVQGLGIGVGGSLALSPEILSAYSGLRGIYNSENPILQGITKTPQQIGQQMNAGEETAGISGQLPVRSGMKPRFPKTSPDVITVTPEGTAIPGGTPMDTVQGVSPTTYPKNKEALLNFMKSRIDQYGDKLPVQELADYKRMLPDMFNKMEVVRGTPQYALASQIQDDVASLHSAAIPGREGLNQAYGISKTLHPEVMDAIKNFVQKYGKAALKEAIGVGLGVGATKALFK